MMVAFNDRRVYLSSRLVKVAGFRQGQRVMITNVIRTKNGSSVSLTPTRQKARRNSGVYTVDTTGRIRISERVLRNRGVKIDESVRTGKSKNRPRTQATRKNITIVL